MKLKCKLVQWFLAARTDGAEPPAWAGRHAERCDECRAAAEGYARLARLVKGWGERRPGCGLEWSSVRAAMERSPSPQPSPARGEGAGGLRPAMGEGARATLRARRLAAAGIALLALVIGGSIWLGGGSQRRPERQAPATQLAKSMPKRTITPPGPAAVATRQPAIPQHPASIGTGTRMLDTKPKPRRVPVRRYAPKRRWRLLSPEPILVKNETPSPPATAPAAPQVVIVAPEEHVIDVVGATVGDRADEAYVIRHVDVSDSGDSGPVYL